MKKILTAILIVLIGSISYAKPKSTTPQPAASQPTSAFQQKVTYDQAASLIGQYQDRQTTAEKSLADEKSRIDTLKSEIAVLDAEIANLTAQLASLKANPTPKESGQYTYYVVKEGDFLAKLAEYPEVYGRGNYAMWPKIYHANQDQIKTPTLIRPGQKLRIPR